MKFTDLLDSKRRQNVPEVIRLLDQSAEPESRFAHHPRRQLIPAKPAKNGASQADRRTLRKRIAVLLAAIAVPAMAAPGDFGAVAGSAPLESDFIEQKLADTPTMPFEKAGMSFPGSAFYYLADPPSNALVALPTADPLDSGADDGRELGQLIDAGPAASPLFSAGSGVSQGRALDCLAQAVWYEAASEGEAGQRAVAQVVLNRVAHPSWPTSVCGVVYQGSQRSTGCQFTFTCDGSLARRASGASWTRARRIAGEALAGRVYAPIGHATHYHTLWVNPRWASRLDHVGTIGAHRFYKNRGKAGSKAAFTSAYAGSEPGVSDRAASNTIPTPSLRATASSTPRESASRASVAGSDAPDAPAAFGNPAPAAAATGSPLADPGLQAVGQVKQEYIRAGTWKKRPPKLDGEEDSDREKAPQD